MKLWRHLLFALNSAWQSFWRSAAVSLAATATVTLILTMAGINLLVGHTLAGVLDEYRARVSVISISVADDTPLTTVTDFNDQLRSDPPVVGVSYLINDEALAGFQADPVTPHIALHVEGNHGAAKLMVRLVKLADQ